MKWININQQLPRQGKEVLIRWKDYENQKFTSIATLWRDTIVFGHSTRRSTNWHFTYCNVDGSTSLDNSQVTHWMPLPEPPKP